MDNDSTFNAEYVELVWGEADSVQRRLEQLAADHRETARIYADLGGADVLAARFNASAAAYEHAVSMLDLAFEQAMARVARQVTA